MADISKIQLPDGNQYNVKDTTKQPLLVSGTNIKTINNQSLLGSGNISIEDKIFWATYGTTTSAEIITAYQSGKLACVKYDGFTYVLMLIVENQDLCIFVCQNGSQHQQIHCSNTQWDTSTVRFQSQLVSGTNIKTVNNNSLLGSGNITIEATVTAMTDQEIEIAIDAGWVVPSTVTISLTNPRSSSDFSSCPIYGLDTNDPTDTNRTLLGTITSPTGSITVETNQPYLLVNPQGAGVYIYPTSVSTSGDVEWDSSIQLNDQAWFAITGDGTITLDRVNYDF